MPTIIWRFTLVLAIRTTETWTPQSAVGAVFLLLFVLIVAVALLRRYLRR